MPRVSAFAALATALLIACDSGATPGEPSAELEAIAYQPASVAKPNPSFQPFAFSVDNCVETVDVAGTFHEVTQLFVGANGKETLPVPHQREGDRCGTHDRRALPVE